MNTIYN